uniref:glycosyltransferase family 2 protein n=1 Tax=Paractinoplanes polyasparticus TaxID=2856853 RepID=UPI001C8578A4|nr:glycosyltransferase family 2 protein [Actinoplanes polyasparticus]
MPLKVSVVVPVYNPGPYIEDCIQSLVSQSLPKDEYEVWFVDDGSTDETPARLDQLALEQPNVHVIHQEPSGWSGKPRNVGIDAAQGDYIMFVDNDDYLGAEALERMYDYGVANGADVVVGKMAGKGRPVPRDLFRKNRPRAGVQNAPLIDSLTPHKMLRREFLAKTGLRFREGRRRLEDHVFVTEAYLRAENVSVLSDYVCYYHVKRDDASNAGFRPIDPVGYFGNLREALDIVDQYTEPGPLQDGLFRRWLRNEIVERLRAQRLLNMDPEYRREMFREMRSVAVDRFGPGVAAGLSPIQQVVAGLLVADRLEDVETLAEWEATVKPIAELQTLAWRDGALRVAFTVEYAAGGERLTFVRAGSDVALALPIPQSSRQALALLEAGISAQSEKSKVDLVIRERSTAAEFFQPVEFERVRVPAADDAEVRLRIDATATVDPRTAAGGGPVGSGIWDAYVRYSLSGWAKETRLGSVREPAADSGRRLGIVGGVTVLPYWTDPHQNLSIDVNGATSRLKYDLSVVRTADATVEPGRLRLSLPVYSAGESAGSSVRLTDAATGAVHDFGAEISPAEGGSVLESTFGGQTLAAGRYKVAVVLGQRPTALRLGLVVDGRGAISVQSAEEIARQVAAKPPPRKRPFVRRALRKIKKALGA